MIVELPLRNLLPTLIEDVESIDHRLSPAQRIRAVIERVDEAAMFVHVVMQRLVEVGAAKDPVHLTTTHVVLENVASHEHHDRVVGGRIETGDVASAAAG